MSKDQIRKDKLAERLVMDPAEHREKSLKICWLLKLLFDKNPQHPIANQVVESIGLYYPVKKEVDIRSLPAGYFPKTEGDLCQYYPSSWHDLQKGAFGVYEPVVTGVPFKPGLILVPGIAFSPNGNRIGFGHGYFDRTLKLQHGIRVGVAFDFQIVDTIPAQPWDVPMDLVVTETRIIHCHFPDLQQPY